MKTHRVSLVSIPRRAPGGKELRARIIREATDKFLALGFSRVTTDELAAGLGISKATLYRHFGSKDAILTEIVESIEREILAHVDAISTDGSMGFLDKITRLMVYMGECFSRLGPVLMKDIHRHAPRVWEKIEAFRTRKIQVVFRGLLEAGVREGSVRSDVDLALLVQIYLTLVQRFIRPDSLFGPGQSPGSVLDTLFKVFFGGILTGPARDAFFSRGTGFGSLIKESDQ